MRAVVLRAPGELALGQVPEPRAGEDELLVEVEACGICRTDLQLADGDLVMRRRPLVPGHQVAGRLVESGEPVGVAWLHWACGRCRYCRGGRENLCPRADFTGWTVDGGYAERVLVRRGFIFPLPAGLEPVQAAPLLCAGIIGYRSLRLCGIEAGGRLGLYGFGSSAHLAIQVARHWGCEIYVSTRSAAERERALRLGAAWAGGAGEAPPEQLDAAITFAPAGSVVVAALAALAPGGTVAVNAIHLDRMPEFPYELLWRERSLRSVANFTRADATEFLALAARIPVLAEVETFPLARAADALARLREGRIGGSAVLDLRL